MKIYILSSLLTFTTICFAQKNEKKEGTYSAFLSSVEVPKGFNLGVTDSVNSVYEDSLIRVDWNYLTSQIEFELTNKTNQTIKVSWDDAVFISITNESNRIFHKGIKYTDRESTQSPTSIYRNSTLSDLIAPTSYASFSSGQYGGWNSRPLIPTQSSLWSTSKYEESLIGRTMRVVLPIKIEDKVIEYLFNFKTVFIDRKKKQ